jgi:hypothetical protein
MSICKSELTGGGSKYIKIGNDSFLAIEGVNITDKMLLSDLRINYSDIYKSKFKITKQSTAIIDYTENSVVFIAIKVNFNLFKLEEEKFLIWKYTEQNLPNNLGQLMVLTGNSTNPVGVIEIQNINTKYDVEVEIMLATYGKGPNTNCQSC